jgi:hypothetical protein
MQRLQATSKGAAENLAKQAAAVSLVSSSMGESGGNIGRFNAGAGQIAAAYGAGGPFAASLVGGVALVGKFNQYLEDTIAAQDRLIDQANQVPKHVSAINKIKDEIKRLRLDMAGDADPISERFQQATDRANHLEEQLEKHRTSGKRWNRQYIENTEREIKANRDLADTLMETQMRRSGVRDAAGGKAPSFGDTRSQAQKDADAFIVTAQVEEDIERDHQAELTRIEEAGIAERARLAQEDFKRRAELEKLTADREAKHREMTERADEMHRQNLLRAEQERHQQTAALAMQGASIVAGVSTQLIADLIAGQEYALERAGIALMAQAGQALVGQGITLLGQSVVEAMGPAFAKAPITAAAGIGLIGAGVGLGGVAAGIGGLMGGAGNAQAGGLSLGSPALGGAVGGQTAAATTINIVYAGASGPTAEQGAAAVTSAMQRSNRRNLTARSFA